MVRYVETPFLLFGLRAEGFQFADKLGAFFSGKKLFDNFRSLVLTPGAFFPDDSTLLHYGCYLGSDLQLHPQLCS
jgi:hypothetical protein